MTKYYENVIFPFIVNPVSSSSFIISLFSETDFIGLDVLSQSFIVRETFSLSKSISNTFTFTLCPTLTTSVGLVTK